MHEVIPKEADALPQILEAARCCSGQTLSELTHEAPTLVVFLRHAGCSFCREALSDLAAVRADIERAGVNICLVHMGAESEAAPFFAEYGLGDLPRVSDPEQNLYRAFGLERGRMRQLFGPAVIRRGVAAAAQGHRTGLLAGDGFQGFQMPGVFLLHEGVILRAFRHETAADRPDYQALARTLHSESAHA